APLLIPPQEKIQLIERRKKMSAASALSAAGLREYDMELRTVLLPMMDRLLNPRPPAVANTDGDPLEFHTLRFDLPDPTAAVAQLRDLAVGVEEDDFESGIERDPAGRVVRADISWLRAGGAGTAMENTVLGHIKVEVERLMAMPEVQAALRETLRRHYHSWPDEQLPALGGRTPREAVQDPDGREAVQALLRQFERDMKRQDPALTAGIIDELRATLGIS